MIDDDELLDEQFLDPIDIETFFSNLATKDYSGKILNEFNTLRAENILGVDS